MLSTVCSAKAYSIEEDFNGCVAVEFVVSSVVGCSDWSLAVCSTTVCFGCSFAINFIVCSVASSSGCSTLKRVEEIVA